MTDYSTWTEKQLQVTSLQLDPKNPRLPNVGASPTQREIAAELVRHDGAYELARDIADQGFFPTEVLVAVHVGSETIVVEGNRRLTALKCLLSPEFAPDEYIKRFRGLQQRVSSETIRKVRTLVAPSREAAAPLIINRHTRIGVEGWEPQQQAKFIAQLLTPGVPIEELGKQYGLTSSEILANLRMHTMYQIACNLPLPDKVLAEVRNPRAFSASTLDRLISNSATMDTLGAKFSASGDLIGTIDALEFKKGFGRIVSDIALKKINSRALNSVEDIKKYLGKLGKETPDKSKKGQFTAETFLEASSQPTSVAPKSAKKAKPAKAVTTLIPRNFKCDLNNQRINEVLVELKSLKVADYENAVAVLFRIFIELSTSHYLETSGKNKPLLDWAKKNNKKQDWSPTLRQMLREVLKDPDIKLTVTNRRALNKTVDDDNHSLSLDTIDQFVHNRFHAPSERDLRRFWDVFHELTEQFMTEPMQPSGGAH